jgi:NAD(P)H dehydrogenase (quinone)
MSPPKVAIVIYSLYGHVAKRMLIVISTALLYTHPPIPVAEAVKAGIESAGGKVTIHQFVQDPPFALLPL